jgi:hypothetical protein
LSAASISAAAFDIFARTLTAQIAFETFEIAEPTFAWLSPSPICMPV